MFKYGMSSLLILQLYWCSNHICKEVASPLSWVPLQWSVGQQFCLHFGISEISFKDWVIHFPGFGLPHPIYLKNFMLVYIQLYYTISFWLLKKKSGTIQLHYRTLWKAEVFIFLYLLRVLCVVMGLSHVLKKWSVPLRFETQNPVLRQRHLEEQLWPCCDSGQASPSLWTSAFFFVKWVGKRFAPRGHEAPTSSSGSIPRTQPVLSHHTCA